jgi:hypothetical protein
MVFDARKDYRQTLKFFNENFVPKEPADSEGGKGAEDVKIPVEGGPVQEEDQKYDNSNLSLNLEVHLAMRKMEGQKLKRDWRSNSRKYKDTRRTWLFSRRRRWTRKSRIKDWSSVERARISLMAVRSSSITLTLDHTYVSRKHPLILREHATRSN